MRETQMTSHSNYGRGLILIISSVSNRVDETVQDQWCKQDQIVKTKTTGSKQRHLADLTFKWMNANVDLYSSDVPSTEWKKRSERRKHCALAVVIN